MIMHSREPSAIVAPADAADAASRPGVAADRAPRYEILLQPFPREAGEHENLRLAGTLTNTSGEVLSLGGGPEAAPIGAMIYAVLRRDIDAIGLATHSAQLVRGDREYDLVVAAIMNSAEARAKHQATGYRTLPPLEYLPPSWIGMRPRRRNEVVRQRETARGPDGTATPRPRRTVLHAACRSTAVLEVCK